MYGLQFGATRARRNALRSVFVDDCDVSHSCPFLLFALVEHACHAMTICISNPDDRTSSIAQHAKHSAAKKWVDNCFDSFNGIDFSYYVCVVSTHQ